MNLIWTRMPDGWYYRRNFSDGNGFVFSGPFKTKKKAKKDAKVNKAWHLWEYWGQHCDRVASRRKETGSANE